MTQEKSPHHGGSQLEPDPAINPKGDEKGIGPLLFGLLQRGA